jgi:hypothetical protein
MTTQKNIVNKVVIKISLVIVAIFFSGSLMAQKSFKSYDLKNSTTELFKKGSSEIAEAFFAKKEEIKEEEVSFEEWMIDLENFSKSLDSSSVDKQEAKETLSKEELEILNEQVELEDWMMELDWNYKSSDFLNEAVVELESWMTDLKKW